MRRWFRAAGVGLTLAALAAAAEPDFGDLDDALMRDMDDAIKELDSNLGSRDADASRANVAVLREGLAWAEQYFAQKPDAPLGAGYARDGRRHLEQTAKAVEAQDYDAANAHLRGVVRSCKACHEAYKTEE
jgi:cytochrome c556